MRAEENVQMTTLSPQSYQIVMTAIKHARLKGHNQVQPLHVAAALLDPVSRSLALHNACLQSLRDPTHPLKCDALDLCFKIALDRLPVITDREKLKEQSMSNALGAALKRAHANERRGTPEQSLQPLLAVKTGIAHLTISILDDPSVSRVFKEAGFSSTAVKQNMEEQVAQHALAGAVGTSSSMENPAMRRIPISMAPFSSPRLDSLQFRNSLFSAPFLPGEPSCSSLKLQTSNDMDPESQLFRNGIGQRDLGARALPFASTTPKFQEAPLQHKRPDQPWMLSRLTDHTYPYRHEADIRNIVDVLLFTAKKLNPVLVSDTGVNSVVKEFSQRLTRGDIARLPGVQLMDFPFTSLSVGLLSQEVVDQKLAKLRRDVDVCLQTGGGIIFVGDLQWLLEPSHSMASLILQGLQQLMSSNAYSSLWLLAFASPKAVERYQVNSHALMESLGLHPVQLAAEGFCSALPSRHGSKTLPQLSLLSQPGGVKFTSDEPVLIQNGQEKLECCPECNSKFQRECSILVKEEKSLSLWPLGPEPPASLPSSESTGNDLAALKRSPKLPWMQNQNKSVPLPVKAEKDLVTSRIEELRQKWQLKCSSTHHLQPGSFTSVGLECAREESASPVAEVVSPQEGSSRMSLPFSPSPDPPKCKVSTEMSLEIGGVYSQIPRGYKPSIPQHGSKPATSLRSADAEARRGIELGSSPLSQLRNGGAPGLTLSMKANVLLVKSYQPAPALGADLALGRASLGAGASVPVHKRGFKEEVQNPLHTRMQLPSNPKTFKMGMTRSSDKENLHELFWKLSSAVGWQKEAVVTVAETVIKCRGGNGRRTGVYARTDAWLMFLGPDRVGKREIARALARQMFGREEEHFILLTGWKTDASSRTPSSTGILAADSNGVKYRGKTPLERLAEALIRKPFSVVLVEDIDRADSFLMRNLIKAMDRGRLVDSTGREVSLANVIVIMTCGAGASLLCNQAKPQGKRGMEFDEDKLSGLAPWEVKLFVDDKPSESVLHTNGKGLSIVESVMTDQHQESLKEKPVESILLFGSPMGFKRKADCVTESEDLDCTLSSPEKVCKREESSPNRAFSLDLNLSVEENLSEDEGPCVTEEFCETSQLKSLEELTSKVIDCARVECPPELFSLLDAAVVFKPFDLDGLTDWVLQKLEIAVEGLTQRTVKAPVEISTELLQAMVLSAWENFSNPEVLQGWVDDVLMKAIQKVLKKGVIRPDAVVKLTGVERVVTMFPEFEGSSKVELLPKTIHVDQ